MQVDQQKALAKTILDSLKPHGFNIILAGGAVRDWYRGEEANDLDFFLAGEPRPDALSQIIGHDVIPLTDKTYESSLFEGFECEIDGQVCQFLFHKCECPRELVANRFPVSSSKCWYDGEEYWYDRWFLIGERYHALIIYTDFVQNWHIVDKAVERMAYPREYASYRHFFEAHFREGPRPGQWIDDLGFAGQA